VVQGEAREEDVGRHDGKLQQEIGAPDVDHRDLLARCSREVTDLKVQMMLSRQACEAHQHTLTLRVLEAAASKGCRQLLQGDCVREDGDADTRRRWEVRRRHAVARNRFFT
jgi:hypothetical protein